MSTFKSVTKVRVRYAETDAMGVVYYGNYALYFEVGRVEAMRELGTSYKVLEDMGIGMPVVSMESKYIRPAKYDDLLTVVTYIKEIPKARMCYEYEIFNQHNVLLHKGATTLAFLNYSSGKVQAAPDWFVHLVSKQISDDNI